MSTADHAYRYTDAHVRADVDLYTDLTTEYLEALRSV